MKKEYIIIGDTKNYKDCLICCAGYTIEQAEKTLDEVLNGTKWYNEKARAEHTNIRIATVKAEDAWWNDPVMVR